MKNKGSNQPAGAPIPSGEAAASEVSQVEYSLSSGLYGRLARLDVSLAFTSYQSSLLYLLGRKPEGGLHLHQSAVPKPMGLGVASADRLVLASGAHIVRYENILAPHERINNTFDACYVPRTAHLTGDLDAHDVGIDKEGQPIFVNTRYNCLATVSSRHSFEMVWKPSFISGLLDGDKCHLNGMAMDEGRPAYVTAVSRSDVIDGWRDRRSDGGVVIDVATGKVVCHGLSMPHSPRMHKGELWVLNSGTGELGVVKLPDGKRNAKGGFEPRIFCPGFVRGLAFGGKYAFVGLSKPRYKRFEGLALDQRLKDADAEPWCGVQVIDLEKGACVDWLRIDGAVAELYDVGVIPGFKCPMAVSPGTVDAATLITVAPTEDSARNLPAASPPKRAKRRKPLDHDTTDSQGVGANS